MPTLPELLMPDGLPAFQAEGHAIGPVALYADVPMRTGHDRRRRIYTTAPRMVAVSLVLDRSQMLDLHEWFEAPLDVGAQWFSAEVANQGPGSLWWKARFLEPYGAESLPGGLFNVSARLLLVGSGQADRPYTPDMRARVQVSLAGLAALTAPPVDLAAELSVALLPALFLAAAVRVALLGRSIELREDSSRVLREDGGYVVREF